MPHSLSQLLLLCPYLCTPHSFYLYVILVKYSV
jgi:hypothetical protein